MNRLKKFFKSKRLNNRGLTLIELLMAIAILAIIIVPVFGSFITSARVNMRARRTLAATDVVQTIFEGFADKTYETGVKSSIGQLSAGSGVLSGNSALSTLDNNYYNDASHCIALPQTVFDTYGVSVSKNEIRYNGGIYTDPLALISGNGVPVTTVSINNVVAQAANYNIVNGIAGAEKAIMTWSSGDGAALAYSDVEMEGHHFDVVVTFIPMMKTPTDKYYTYCVTITIYDAKQEDPAMRFQESELLDVMLGGIAAK